MSMLMILSIAGCLMGLLLLAVAGLAIFLVMRAEERDTVSTARQDWIQRRSEKDEQGW